jgi:hypothetical protein
MSRTKSTRTAFRHRQPKITNAAEELSFVTHQNRLDLTGGNLTELPGSPTSPPAGAGHAAGHRGELARSNRSCRWQVTRR